MKKIIICLTVLANSVFSLDGLTQAQIDYFSEECKNGNTPFCAGLGEIYLLGALNFNKDYEKAKFYLEKVCKKDKSIKQDEYFLEACSNLGSIYETGGFGVKQNYKKAIEAYAIACDGGFAIACSNIGFLYESGQGVQKDMSKGIAYYKKACDKGGAVGCYNLASYYYNYGDKNKDVVYLKKACDLGKNNNDIQNIPRNKTIWLKACDLYNILK